MSLINAIDLTEDFSSYNDASGTVAKRIQPLSRINIFVGANNSGKSRFMRLLAAQTEYKISLKEIDLRGINTNLSAIIDKMKQALKDAGLNAANDLADADLDSLQNTFPNSLRINADSYKDIREKFERWSKLPDITRTRSSDHSRTFLDLANVTNQKLKDTIIELSSEALNYLNMIPVHSESTQRKRVYIPTLRGLRPFTDNIRSDFYLQRTRDDYFGELNQQNQPDIFTGLSFFERLTEMLLGDNQDRKAIAGYQEFISEALFEGRPIALIPSPRKKVVVVKIGTEREQPIYNLGDGIQSAIILSFLPYVMQEPAFFFIEEPEMYLHPGLQRKILNFFASRQMHVFFLTTHSNHFLDITIDIKDVSIFTFRKELGQDSDDDQTPTFMLESINSGDSSSLELLGVRNSSIFLVNATIWVEGITDRWYLRAMLNAYLEYLRQAGSAYLHLEEDVHYSFVEYGGANITHWSFLDEEEHPIEVERLCSRAMIVVDKDGDSKLARKEALQKKLGDNLIILPGREIENLLPYSIIKEVVLEYEGDTDVSIEDYFYSVYEDVYLGRFIEDRMLKGKINRRGGYKAGSGTIKSKVDFCERAVKKVVYTDLPKSTQEVITKLYEFIRSRNI